MCNGKTWGEREKKNKQKEKKRKAAVEDHV